MASRGQSVTGMFVLDAYIVPDEVGHSWPALGVESGIPGDYGNRKEIHDNEMIRMLPVGG